MIKLFFYVFLAVVIVSIIPLVAPFIIPVLAVIGAIWLIAKFINILGGN